MIVHDIFTSLSTIWGRQLNVLKSKPVLDTVSNIIYDIHDIFTTYPRILQQPLIKHIARGN